MTSAARRLTAAALLGLPAALLAHVFVFGSEHTLGGAMHASFLEIAAGFGFVATLLIAVGAVRRSHTVVPHVGSIGSSAALWLAAIELCERAHGIPLPLLFAALAVAAWIVRGIAGAFAHTVVAIAQALRPIFASALGRVAACSLYRAPLAPALADRFRLFSRPPPAFA